MPLPPLAWSARATTPASCRLMTCVTCGPAMCPPGTSGDPSKPNGAWAWMGERGWTMRALATPCARSCAFALAGAGVRYGQACKPWSTPRSRLGGKCGSKSRIKSRAGHPAYLGQSPKKANASLVFTTPATSSAALAATPPAAAHCRKNPLKASPTAGSTKLAMASARHSATDRNKNLNKSIGHDPITSESTPWPMM